jgi:cytochrome-b5 reductase
LTASSLLFGTSISAKETQSALDPKQFKPFTLQEIYPQTHNTKIYRFALPSQDQELGLPVASCLVVKAQIGGEEVIRPYTPISEHDEKGHFDLLVKDYPQGKMSRHISQLQPGDQLQCKGPLSKIEVTPNFKKKIGMIAGGTGLTPMYQVLLKILNDPTDKTEVSFIFANVSEKDVPLKYELDTLASRHPNFKVYYLVDKKESPHWKGGEGYVTTDLIKSQLPPPNDDHLIMVCGPPGFMNVVSGDKAKDYTQGPLSGLLKQLGYTEKQVFKF